MKSFFGQPYKKGFTLIELLVVIAIIGILSTIVVVALGAAKAKSRDARRLSDVRNIALALEQYYSDNTAYPTQPLTSSPLAPNYLPVMPTDPATTLSGAYRYMAMHFAAGHNCNANNPAVKYHLAVGLEISAADGSGAFAQDADDTTIPSGYDYCAGNSDTGFYGRTITSGATICCGTAQLAAGSVESCYDVTN